MIASVNGHALGAGFELALACDLRVAAAEATFGLPEVRVGVPSVIQAALLPPLVGPGRAAELLLTGATIGAEQALAWGLVNRVVDRAGLRGGGRADGRQIHAACAPGAVRLQKQLIVRWRESDLPAAVRAADLRLRRLLRHRRAARGDGRLPRKRAPRFEDALKIRAVTVDFWGTLLLDPPGPTTATAVRVADFETILGDG